MYFPSILSSLHSHAFFLPHLPSQFSALKTSLQQLGNTLITVAIIVTTQIFHLLPTHPFLSSFPLPLLQQQELNCSLMSTVRSMNELYILSGQNSRSNRADFSWFSCCLFLDQSPRNKRWQIPIRSYLVHHSGANLQSFSCLCENFSLLFFVGESSLIPGRL